MGPFFLLNDMKPAFLLSLLFLALPVIAQDQASFNDIEAADELQDHSSLLANEEVNAEALNAARARISIIESAAAACAEENSIARSRLEERFGPFREIVADQASAESLLQRQSIANALDEAIARQARCEGLVDEARALSVRISDRQNEISQQFLSARSSSILALAQNLPQRVASWPAKLREQLELNLIEGISTTTLLWFLVIAGLLAAVAGLLIRNRFTGWYMAAGGDDAPPQMKYLFPKPLAEFAPLWLEGAVLYSVLTLTIAESSSDIMVVRVAIAVFAFGLSSVVVNWATGPLSPSAAVKGLIPDHVAPLRLRLRFLTLTFCLSYIVLSNEWLSVRGAVQPDAAGRALMILMIAVGLLSILTYLGRIPGLQGRYRLLRFTAITTTGIAVIAMLTGYQNLAGYLVQGVAGTGLVFFLLWVLLWLFYAGFNYLLEQNTTTATQVRNSLGITGKGSGTGIGFMQLVADLILWIGAIVCLIYIWDNTGSTLGKLRLSVVDGWDLGGVSLVPTNVVGGILLFAVLVVVIGWIKRWVDRRWLKRVMIERGARNAILTLFGYIAFVLAILVSLKAASVDLTGLAIIGGALALGLGFGLQSIANNFVSGLILLFERPIRAGDFISVGDIDGFVRSIRIRATEIETLDNKNVLVPNSELVSGRVTNWVLRDTHGRLQLKVGVAYGSDVEKVRDILESIGREHPEVITDGGAPAPRALFMGFGDSSLDFELRVRIRHIERRFSVISDMTFTLDKALRDAGITIPFPQRDLHIVSYPEQSLATPLPDHGAAEPVVATEDVTRSHRVELDTDCERADVWAAISDIESLKRWLVRDGEFTPQIGGHLELHLRDGYSVTGRIDIFIPPRRMRIVLAPAEQDGPLPTGPITIDIAVRERDGASRLTVTVAGIPGSEDWEEYYRLSVDRWQTALAELKSDVLRK